MTALKCFIASNRHGTYCVPASSRHRPAAKAILGGEVWEPDTLAFLAASCGTGDVIHAGTYFGDFLPALSKSVHDGARVWAFEPSSENFRCAEITLKLNAIFNVTLSRAALGAGPGRALLCLGRTEARRAGGGSMIVPEPTPGFDCEEVPVVAIDDVVPRDRHISVLQLDVEKYEQQALAGALSTIARCRPVLVLETLPADSDWFARNVLCHGYEAAGMFEKNHAFRVR